MIDAKLERHGGNANVSLLRREGDAKSCWSAQQCLSRPFSKVSLQREEQELLKSARY
ncbi:MAG TPA: hypothetical protein VME69_04240 [Methylocella sp.]|nr:hypothetical protein [Methylocella sp.]